MNALHAESFEVSSMQGHFELASMFRGDPAPKDEGPGGTLEIRGYGKGDPFDLNRELSRAEELIGTVLATLPSPEI